MERCGIKVGCKIPYETGRSLLMQGCEGLIDLQNMKNEQNLTEKYEK